MFQTVPLSIIRSSSLYTQQRYMSYKFADSLRAVCSILSLLASCQQTCMTCTIAVCTVKNSWWRTEELSETCRVLFQKYIWEISASSWFYYKNPELELLSARDLLMELAHPPWLFHTVHMTVSKLTFHWKSTDNNWETVLQLLRYFYIW